MEIRSVKLVSTEPMNIALTDATTFLSQDIQEVAA